MIQYFLLGALTVYIVLPITDSILSIIITLLEVIKGFLAVKLAKLNDQIVQLEDVDYSTKRPIGFLIENEEAEECDSET